MGIIISGIDMPTNCTQCPCSDDGARFCRAANEYIPMLGKPNFCPLVEAEERKTGKWIQRKGMYEIGYKCSECDAFSLTETSYCAKCGAKMEHNEDDQNV